MNNPPTITLQEGASNFPFPPIIQSLTGPPSGCSSMPSIDTPGSLLQTSQSKLIKIFVEFHLSRTHEGTIHDMTLLVNNNNYYFFVKTLSSVG